MRPRLTSQGETALPRLWQVAGGVLLGCALTLLLLHASRAFSRENPPVEPDTLAAKLGPVRLTEGRVDGQTAYAPYRKRFLGRDPALEQFRREVREHKSRPSPSLLRDQAFFHLLSDNLDRAIADLEEASRLAPGEAALLSDLSAVYAERAHVKSRPEDYVTALEMAERAVIIRPDLSEAVFNRVLALEHLFLFDSARDGWRRYLEIDTRSPWADEAGAHLEELLSIGTRQPSANRRDLQLRKIAEAAPPIERQFHEMPRIAETIRALDLVRNLGKHAEVAAIENLLADSLQALGQPAQAWKYRYLALAWASRLQTSGSPAGQQFSTALKIFEGAARHALRQRLPESALAFQSRALAVAETLRRPEDIVLARLNRSRINAALGRQEEAKRDFSQALRALEGVQAGARERFAADLDVVRREIQASEDRVAALASELLASEHFDAQASFEFQRGDTAAAESIIARALDELERSRANVPPGTYRVSFFDQAWPLYERMVSLQLNLDKPEKALEVLERFRARTLLDQIDEIQETEGRTTAGVGSTTPLEWQELCRRLPEHTVIVVYAVVEGRLVTWLVRPSGIRLSPYQADWATVASRIQALRATTDRGNLLERLHDELVAPWKGELQDSDQIIFVPTRDLYGVPFAALLDPISRRFLIQDHAVGVAPSASEFVAAVERDRRISARPLTHVFLIGNPVRSTAGQLPSLPGSTREIQLLSHIYQGLHTRVLTGERNHALVLVYLYESDIAHFAVHALEDDEDPSRSGLLIFSSGASRKLTADILELHPLIRTRLVVLAACGSHAGPVSESEGSLSLTHYFLAAGVPVVVGSLWQVDDASTARLSVRFHQEFRRGADALTALRTAQLAEIEAGSALTDWTWASFQVFGGAEARVP
jgi:CHAT domain-containing protein